MKRRIFLIALGVVPPLVLKACKKDEPIPPTIFTGYVIDENDKPVEGTGFQFGGITGGFNAKLTFNVKVKTDVKGYYYIEQVIPKETGGIEFQPTEGDGKYPDGSYKRLCLVNGVYQKEIPWIANRKNELNFKIVKR
ncbi:MAG: hypothetical protein U5N85_13305 [Arcicella sp.]|nr:hypothetical protein [Arcicella sp.]